MQGLSRLLLAAVIGIAAAGCSINTLGGREKCWSEHDPRMASLWRGTLQIDAFSARLLAPEGDLVLLPGTLTTQMGEDGVGELASGSDVLARSGDAVTLWGGIGGDGTMVVCYVEETRAS